MRRWVVRAALAAGVVVALMQLLPFGRIDERRVTSEAPWPSDEARRVAVAACYDCHSNEPTLEWFDRIAPGSWLVARHVRDGRDKLNFSEWDNDPGEVDDGAETILEGEMPLREYVWLHPEARLSDEERQTLVAALHTLEASSDSGDDDRESRGTGRGGREHGDG